VPHRIDACRCGFKQADLEVVSIEPQPAAARGGRSAGFVAVLTVIVLIAVAALMVWRRTPPDGPRAQTSGSPPAPLAPQSVEPATLRTTAFARLAPDSAAVSAAPSAPVAPASLEDIVGQALPAVASIDAGTARGTGFFVKPDTVLTNAHVVQEQTSVKLVAGSASYTARVAAVDNSVDLAVLQVYGANPAQATLRLGSASGARVGEEVVAIGSALGVLSNTVTRGIVSAFRTAGTTTLIQTDAAINPGNSGGPLLNRNGQVIGINSMSVSKQAGEGLAFAVAIDHAAALLSGHSAPGSNTPLGSLQQQMSGGRSDADAARDRGEAQYAQALQTASRAADAIDDYWNRYAPDCLAGASRAGDRPWFDALGATAIAINPSSRWDCGQWLETVRLHADEVRATVQQASEAARQHGVYPGVLRDLRRRYRLDWTGW
jgi:S1-C subfamily serine protease